MSKHKFDVLGYCKVCGEHALRLLDKKNCERKAHLYGCNNCNAKLSITGATLVDRKCKNCEVGVMKEKKSTRFVLLV